MDNLDPITLHDDFVTSVEESVAVLEDLLAISIEEIGNGGGRAISVLLSAQKVLENLRARMDNEAQAPRRN